jgi:mono/diheme cytochrome c family protein
MKSRNAWYAAAAALALVLGGRALADDHHRDRTALLPAYKQECASCHVAYPPGMLPAQSWQRLMSNLSQHFGTDASIEPAQIKQLEGWLVSNAATRRVQQSPAEDRITRSAWFVREHRKVSEAVWNRPSVKGPANCAACHTRADQGDYDEHAVRIPQ